MIRKMIFISLYQKTSLNWSVSLESSEFNERFDSNVAIVSNWFMNRSLFENSFRQMYRNSRKATKITVNTTIHLNFKKKSLTVRDFSARIISISDLVNCDVNMLDFCDASIISFGLYSPMEDSRQSAFDLDSSSCSSLERFGTLMLFDSINDVRIRRDVP